MTTCENIAKRYRRASWLAKAIPRRTALGWLAVLASSVRAVNGDEARLPHDQLLLYRSRSGRLRAVRTLSQWRRRRAEILDAFESIVGRLPSPERRVDLDATVEEETDCGDFVRRRISYASGPSARVPAYLLIPRAALEGRRCPGVLCLHQTHAAGQKVVVGLGNSPDDEYGVELARLGFVCLAPPYPLLANYHPDLRGLGYASGTLKAVWDNRRGLDLLESLPFVKTGRFAAIGHSLGGHNALFTALCDDRIRAVATSCAFDSFADYKNGDITGWTQERYMPRLRAFQGDSASIPFDFHEVIASLAPRGLFVSAPLGDTNFQWASVDRVVTAAREVYRLHGVEDRLIVQHPDGPHRFPPHIRQTAYAFLQKHVDDHS